MTLFSFFLCQKGRTGYRRKGVIVILLVISPFWLMLLIPASPARVGCYHRYVGFILQGKHISISELDTSRFFLKYAKNAEKSK